MANINRLQRFKELLWQKYDDEIRENQDWFYKGWGWEINFVENNNESSCIAYKVKNGITDWNNGYIILEKFIKEWRKIA
jgi:hypothetical protein